MIVYRELSSLERDLGIREHLRKTGLQIPEENYRLRLLGKVGYVLQAHPEDRAMLEARKWLLDIAGDTQ